MAAAGAGLPSTREGYAAAVSGKAANGGRRAAAPTGILPIEKQMKKKGIQADSPTRPATAEREIRQVENHQLPPHHAAGRSFLASASHSARPIVFLSSTVHGAFSLFAKRENGGCKEPAIFMAEINDFGQIVLNDQPFIMLFMDCFPENERL